MAHFAQIQDGIVAQVIVIDNDDAPTEIAGQTFIASLGLQGDWVQTSYHNNPVGEPPVSRGKYAAIGDIWDGSTFTTPVIEDEQ